MDFMMESQNLLVNPGFDIWQRGTAFNISNRTKTADQWVADVTFGSYGSVGRSDESCFANSSAEIYVDPFGTLTFYQSPEYYSVLNNCWGTFAIWVKMCDVEEVTVFMCSYDYEGIEYKLPKFNGWQQCCVQMLFSDIISNPNWPNSSGVKVGIMIESGDENARVLVDGAMLECGQKVIGEMEYNPRNFHEEMELCARYYSAGNSHASQPFWEIEDPSISMASLKNKEVELAQKEAELAAREAKLDVDKNKKRIDFGKSERNLDL